MNYNNKIYEILKKNHGVITSSDCMKYEIPSTYLTRMVSKKLLTRVQRGIYVDQTGDYDDYYFFQLRFNKCINNFNLDYLKENNINIRVVENSGHGMVFENPKGLANVIMTK